MRGGGSDGGPAMEPGLEDSTAREIGAGGGLEEALHVVGDAAAEEIGFVAVAPLVGDADVEGEGGVGDGRALGGGEGALARDHVQEDAVDLRVGLGGGEGGLVEEEVHLGEFFFCRAGEMSIEPFVEEFFGATLGAGAGHGRGDKRHE